MTPGALQTWNRTALWQELQRRDDSATQVAQALQPLLTDLDLLLRSAATGNSSFTLHDDKHAFRVAERIADLLGDQLQLISTYDVGFCLAASYAHDIGMTPEENHIRAHWDALLTSDGISLLSDTQRTAFQRWLDDEHDGLVPPIVAGTPTVEQLAKARLIVAHYARERHNDWSEDWIRSWGQTATVSLYPGWIEHLVRLCRSHHEGYEQLRSETFSPQFVGSPAQVLHLRHCAALLRMADVLDIDPERTPDLIFQRRSVDPSSSIYWHRDHALSILREGHRFTLSARPSDAKTHRAILEVVRSVDAELSLCRRLADEHHFSVVPNLDASVPNEWPFEPRLRAAIAPLDSSYEFVDGTFRPDVPRVLQLLGGLELYGNEWSAVRELLQNAFDAVKESIASERLSWRDPHNAKGISYLEERHRVVLKLSSTHNGLMLTCSDTGIGMTKQLIVDRLLVSGAPKGHADRELERRCNSAGFRLTKTARFGIGVLAYFLLGHSIEITTRRSSAANDGELRSWHFSSDGPGSFGELRPDPRLETGTTVSVLMAETVTDRPATEVSQSLHDYLLETVRFLPCSFEFDSEVDATDSFSWNPGWIPADHGLAQCEPKEENWTSTWKKQSSASTGRREAAFNRELQRFRESVHWEIKQGELPGEMGKYRVHIPHFDTPYGRSLLPMLDTRIEAQAPSDLDFISCHKTICLSWNGISVDSVGKSKSLDNRFVKIAFVEIDFDSDLAATPSVSRSTISLTEAGLSAMEFVAERAEALVRSISRDNRDSNVETLNYSLSGMRPEPDAPLWWFARGGSGEPPQWKPVTFPATFLQHDPPDSSGDWEYNGVKIHVVRGTNFERGPFGEGTYPGAGVGDIPGMPPTAIAAAVQNDRVQAVAPVWTRDTRGDVDDISFDTKLCRFPTAWAHLAVVGVEHYPVLYNADHPLVSLFTPEIIDFRDDIYSVFEMQEDPEIMCEAAVYAAFGLEWMGEEFWDDLTHSRPDIIRKTNDLLTDCGLGGGLTFVDLDEGFASGTVRTVSPLRRSERPIRDLPVPDSGNIIWREASRI